MARESSVRPDPVVVREFPQIGKYRLRVVRSSAGPRASAVLDVREYATGASFEGFTRRGIRISTLAEARQLRDALNATIEGDLLPEGERQEPTRKCARCNRNNPAQTTDLCTVCEGER